MKVQILKETNLSLSTGKEISYVELFPEPLFIMLKGVFHLNKGMMKQTKR